MPFLVACGQTKPAASYQPREEPSLETFVPQENETSQLWTSSVNGRTIALREGVEPETWSLWLLEGDAPVLLTTLQGKNGSTITAHPFTGILGYDGFSIRQTHDRGDEFGYVTYYALEGSSIRCIAYSTSFFEAEDYSVDLNGDDIPELITVNTYGADGARRVRVFRRQGIGVEIGHLTKWPDMPDCANYYAANAIAQEFDLKRRMFQIQYPLNGNHPLEELGLVETTGLEWFTFEAFDEGFTW